MVSDPPAPAKAINDMPMTIAEIDTTIAIVEAVMIFFGSDPVIALKLQTWNICGLLSPLWPSRWQVLCPGDG